MPRVGLTRKKLVTTAMAMADEDGLDSVTLHSLARHYGVAPPSMYKHVRNLEDLQCAIAADALVLFERSLRAADGTLRGLAHAYRSFATNHPGLYTTTQRPHLFRTEEAQDTAHRIVAIIAATLPAGLSPTAVVDQVRIIRSALHGFVSLEHSGGFGIPQSLDRSFEELCATLSALTAPERSASRLRNNKGSGDRR